MCSCCLPNKLITMKSLFFRDADFYVVEEAEEQDKLNLIVAILEGE